jgi:hypothetical protein
MIDSDLLKMVDHFEEQVIVNGVKSGRWDKTVDVPIKNCRLAATDFGKSMGLVVSTDLVLVVDYYGYLKKSKGFLNDVETLRKGDHDSKMYGSRIVYFASITIEDIAAICTNINVIASFPKLKNEILVKRGFWKNRK